VRALDATNAERAMWEPEAFRAEIGEAVSTEAGALVLEVPPFALARIDRGDTGEK
jgi:hypothetical protein